MKRLSLLGVIAFMTMFPSSAEAQDTPVSQMEKLDRGVVVVPGQSGGNFISWRLLGTDDDLTTFTVLRNGTTVVARNIGNKTNAEDKSGGTGSSYQVVTLYNGIAVDTTEAVSPWGNIYKSIPLDRPAKGANGGTYTPNDCSVGDVDGDGQYEIILKWDPSNAQDNSHSNGPTDNVILDCYKLDGTKLWRIDLGPNIRAGAHYTQFLVWDFDGNGKAELICKTAPGSTDATGKYVSEAADNTTIKGLPNDVKLANSGGHILKGGELLTVFNGEGKAVHTIWYNPNRAGGLNAIANMPSSSYWGDNYGNRSERYLATVAYLDGPNKNASAVMVRGYYTRAYLWAVNFDGSKLSQKWLHASETTSKYYVYDENNNKTSHNGLTPTRGSGSKTAHGNGNHNLTCGDVDGDGCDEIIWGACGIDHDGKLMYSTGYGHGDAMHLSDLDPTRPGMEVFTVHESSPYGCDVHDAATGQILYSATASGDTGRGLAADIDGTSEGFEFWDSGDRNPRSAVTGKTVANVNPSTNFRVYWDGDLQDELFDGSYKNNISTPKIQKYDVDSKSISTIANLTDESAQSCNTTKATPCLSADIFGDWREEVILWSNTNPSNILIYTTNHTSNFRLPTLMHDHTYRLAVAWQNVAYNQPPHLGFYLPHAFKTRFTPAGEGGWEQTVNINDSIKPFVLKWANCGNPSLAKSIAPDGTEVTGNAVSGFKFSKDMFVNKKLTIEGAPKMVGDYLFIFKSGANIIDSSIMEDTLVIHCVDPTGIEEISTSSTEDVHMSVYTVGGIKVCSGTVTLNDNEQIANIISRLKPGIYVIRYKSDSREWSTKISKR